MTPKTVTEIQRFVTDEMTKANIRGAEIDRRGVDGVALHVRRTFSVEGQVALTLKYTGDNDKNEPQFRAIIETTFPSSIREGAAMVAFMVVVQELTLLGVTLQAQLDEFEVIMKKDK